MVRTAAYSSLGVGFDSSSTVSYQLRMCAGNKPPATESCNAQPVSSKNVLWRADPSAASAAATSANAYASGGGNISSRDRDTVDWMKSNHLSCTTPSPTSSAFTPAPNANSSAHATSNGNGNAVDVSSGNGNHQIRHLNHDQQRQVRGHSGGIGGNGGHAVSGFAAGFGGLFKMKVTEDSGSVSGTAGARAASPMLARGAGVGGGGGSGLTVATRRSVGVKKEETQRQGEEEFKAGNNQRNGATIATSDHARPPLGSSSEQISAGIRHLQIVPKMTGPCSSELDRHHPKTTVATPPLHPPSPRHLHAPPPVVTRAVVIPTAVDWPAGKMGFGSAQMAYVPRPSRGTSPCCSPVPCASSPSSPSSPFSPFAPSSPSSSCSSSSGYYIHAQRAASFQAPSDGESRAYESRLPQDLNRRTYANAYGPYGTATMTSVEKDSRISGYGGFFEHDFDSESSSFMSACDLCSKRLGMNADIYIYRGEKAFCSAECRQQVILADQALVAPVIPKVGGIRGRIGRP